MDFVLLDKLFYFVLVEVLDAYEAVLLLFGPLKLILKCLNLSNKVGTCLFSKLFS